VIKGSGTSSTHVRNTHKILSLVRLLTFPDFDHAYVFQSWIQISILLAFTARISGN